MNNLFSSSIPKVSDEADIEMAVNNSDKSLAGFFEEIGKINDSMVQLKQLLQQLNEDNERSKGIHRPQAIKELRAQMENRTIQVLKLAKSIKTHLEHLDRANINNRKMKGCEEGTSTDRTRMGITASTRSKLAKLMGEFAELRQKMSEEYRGTIERRYYTVTGEQPSEDVIEKMIETGESEEFLRKAIQQQGRGQIMETVMEIQERHDAVKKIERNLQELHQIFLDMATLVEDQGVKLNSIEENVNRAGSFVENGTTQLRKAKRLQRNSRKWTCIAIIILLIIILVIVLPIVLKK